MVSVKYYNVWKVLVHIKAYFLKYESYFLEHEELLYFLEYKSYFLQHSWNGFCGISQEDNQSWQARQQTRQNQWILPKSEV